MVSGKLAAGLFLFRELALDLTDGLGEHRGLFLLNVLQMGQLPPKLLVLPGEFLFLLKHALVLSFVGL